MAETLVQLVDGVMKMVLEMQARTRDMQAIVEGAIKGKAHESNQLGHMESSTSPPPAIPRCPPTAPLPETVAKLLPNPVKVQGFKSAPLVPLLPSTQRLKLPLFNNTDLIISIARANQSVHQKLVDSKVLLACCEHLIPMVSLSWEVYGLARNLVGIGLWVQPCVYLTSRRGKPIEFEPWKIWDIF